MTDLKAGGIISSDTWVEHPRGRLFVRTWEAQYAPGDEQEKAPVVLLHDSLGCVDLWRDFPAQLSAATGRKVIAYDRLGFGRSDRRDGRLALDFIADEAKTFFPVVREQTGIRKFIAFGHSVGGGMAVNCAAQYPSDCVALITESAQAFLADETVQGIEVAKQQFKEEGQLDRLTRYHGDKAKWVLDAWTETWLDPQFATWTLAGVLPGVRCPVLAIHGAFDEYGSRRHPELIGRLSSGPSRVEIMADTWHVPHREKAEEVVALAAGFISGCA